MEMPVTLSNKGPNNDGSGSNAEPPSTNKNAGTVPHTIPDPPPVIPLITEDGNIANDPKAGEAKADDNSSDPDRQQMEKTLITQMNLLTGTLNTINAQFHISQQEIVQMSSTLSDIKNQQFQKQIQENRDDIDHVTTRVTEIEASIEFYDKERVDIKDHIKRIEQRQKDEIKRVQHITDKQSEKATICECSKGLDQLELTARKKNIIIAGVTEHKDERLKHLTLEILSNTNLPIGLNDIEQAVRAGTYRQRGPPRPNSGTPTSETKLWQTNSLSRTIQIVAKFG